MRPNTLKKTLDALLRDYDFKEAIKRDPIEFPHRYKGKKDIEVSAFIASSLAYGRVELFKPVIEKILSRMGESPHEFLGNFDIKKQKKNFRGIRYRFNAEEDIMCLLYMLGATLKKHKTLKNAFKSFYMEKDPDTGSLISGMMRYVRSIDTSPVYGKDIKPYGLLQFFPSPSKGSACKRACLFLRWMVRDKDIDFGIWKGIPKNKLIIPLDVHIARISRDCLRLTKRKSADWKTAVEITDALKKLDPMDPLKYDFALCHQGISGLCTPDGKRCKECRLVFLDMPPLNC